MLDSYVDEVFASVFDTICMSTAFGEQLIYGLELCERIKKRAPEKVVLLGGAQISFLDIEQVKLIQKESSVDLMLLFTRFFTLNHLIAQAVACLDAACYK